MSDIRPTDRMVCAIVVVARVSRYRVDTLLFEECRSMGDPDRGLGEVD